MLKSAVIGVGLMGRNHARVYADMPNVQLVAVCDANKANAQKIAQKYDTEAYTDLQKMLAKTQPDAISIAVPTSLHEKVATQALQAGCHILIEKPIASTIAEGKRLIDLANARQRTLMVGHIVRFNPAIQLLKQKMTAGDLGRIFQITCRRIGPFPPRVSDVGVVVDLAPHDLDIMRYLLEREPIQLYAETQQNLHTAHEDILLGLIKFPDGIQGSLEINWLTPTKIRETAVLGENGMFVVNDLTQDLFFYENSQAGDDLWPSLRTLKGVSEGQMIRYNVQRQEPLQAEITAFIEAIINHTPPPVTGEDGLAALRISLALVESGKNHQIIKFK